VKLLLVHNTYQQAGGEDAVFEQERRMLEREGHQVITYCRSNWDVDSYHGLRRLSLAKRTVWASDTRREILRLLRQEKPDLVHVHNTFVMVSPSIYSACCEAGVPVVLTLHNYRLLCPAATFFRDGKVCEECKISLSRGIKHACYHSSYSASAVVALMIASHRLRRTWKNEVSCFVALTQFARDKFVEGGLPGEKIFVKPNFVDPDPGGRTGDGEYALFVGRLSPEKGVKTLLEAWKRLRTPIRMLIVGSGPEQTGLEAQAARDGLTNIRFEGQLPREEAFAAIKNARFVIIPSEWYETFCMAIVEAFACSKAVICSRMGAMQELVADGRTGLHFTPGDPDDLAKKVEWAWNHPADLREMGTAARKEYESRYTAKSNYPMLMEIYNRATNAA